MIKQRHIVIKSSSITLTYAEMGDVVCNSSNSIIITLPSPNAGLWYRISNAGSGVVVVYYNSTLTTLKQTEQCLCLANANSSWFFSKGGGTVNKEEIENVLTGEITSHSHPVDAYELPQATANDLGGIKASPKTSGETQEVKIDTATGKLYSTPPASATNGLPAGGTAGQILSKIDGTDYNAQWVVPDAEKILSKPVTVSSFTGKDGYVLAYDETAGEFYLKADEEGGGDVYAIRTFGQITTPTYWTFEPMLSTNKPNPSTYLVFQDIVSVSTVDI